MKKNKNKFKDFWNKIKKPLMIISFIGNILFLIFIIVGCVGTKKQAQQTNAESVDSIPVWTLSQTTWNLNDSGITNLNGDIETLEHGQTRYVLTPIFKLSAEIDSSHVGYDYNCVAIHNWSDVQSFRATYMIDLEMRYYSNYVTTNVSPLRTTVVWRYIYQTSTGGVVKPADHRGYVGDFIDNHKVIFSEYSYSDDNQQLYTDNAIEYFFNDNNASLIYGESNINLWKFEFTNDFNYNAPYQIDANSPFVNESWEEITNVGKAIVYKFYDGFYCNGRVYDTIRLWIWNGYAVRYQGTDGQIRINENQTTGYYGFMQFELVNESYSFLHYSDLVNYRRSATEESGQGTQTYMKIGSNWNNNNYRTLYFLRHFENPYSSAYASEDKLFQFNNQLVSGTGASEVTSNIGVEGVFDLMTTAFGGLMGIMSIQILPNITLGLLLFLPLIVGIILTIIWLVKR